MHLEQWQWRVNFPSSTSNSQTTERERERRDLIGSTERLRKEKEDGSNWVGRMAEKDPAKHTKVNTLTGWSGGTWLPCLLSCIHVYPFASPAQREKQIAVTYPLFSSYMLFPGVPFHFLCFYYADYLNPISLLYILDQMHFCLSVGYSHINAPFILWSRHCFSSPTSAIGLGKQNTYLLGHCRG